MKKIIKKVVSVILTVLIMISVVFTVLAAVYPDISAKTTRIASLGSPTIDGTSCSGMGGISVTSSGNNKRLFVLKTNGNDDRYALYMYKDYTQLNNSSDDEYGRFTLSNFVGHANAMAIDDNYIYITCWKKNGDNGNKIARIKRSMLWSKYKSTTAKDKGTLTANSDGCTILPVVYSDGTAFDKDIAAITYYKNGQFIVRYQLNENNSADSKFFEGVTLSDEKEYLSYTTAQVSNGKFVVNNSKSDVFRVAFATKGTTGQDIGYDPDCGFFVVRWLGGAKNSIIWVKLNSLSGENRVYDSDNSKYRIIKVNKSSNIFKTYELESVSIGSDNCMYASVNTVVTDSDQYSQYSKDAVFKIERPSEVAGSTNFLGYYFAQ